MRKIKNRTIYITIAALFFGFITHGSLADNKPKERIKYFIQTSPEVIVGPNGSDQITVVGNKKCPVTGRKANGIDFVIFHGKKYGFADEKAANEFLKNPDKYLKNI